MSRWKEGSAVGREGVRSVVVPPSKWLARSFVPVRCARSVWTRSAATPKLLSEKVILQNEVVTAENECKCLQSSSAAGEGRRKVAPGGRQYIVMWVSAARPVTVVSEIARDAIASL